MPSNSYKCVGFTPSKYCNSITVCVMMVTSYQSEVSVATDSFQDATRRGMKLEWGDICRRCHIHPPPTPVVIDGVAALAEHRNPDDRDNRSVRAWMCRIRHRFLWSISWVKCLYIRDYSRLQNSKKDNAKTKFFIRLLKSQEIILCQETIIVWLEIWDNTETPWVWDSLKIIL